MKLYDQLGEFFTRSRGVIIFNTFNIVTLRRIIFFKFRRRRNRSETDERENLHVGKF